MTKTRALSPARTLGHIGLLALSALALSACGDQSKTSTRAATTVSSGSSGSSTSSQPVVDAHGELARVPLLAGGHTLAFLQDGASVPQELDDLTALGAAGARLHSSLTLSGDLLPNGAGQTALVERLRVSAFALDDVATAGHLELTASGPTLRTVDGVLYELLGAPALLASPTGRPLWVTGRIDPYHAQLVGPGLTVSNWRPTSTITLRAVGGLVGLRQAFVVDDLDRTGACRFDTSLAHGPSAPNSQRAGRGRLEESDLARLDALVGAANLRSQPTLFSPVIPIYDVPTTFRESADQHGPVSIRIDAGSVLPPELMALNQELQRLAGTLPVLRTLAKGAMSGQSTPSIHVARDPASWATLWALHTSAPPPPIDFQTELVVAAFMGQRTTSGYAIEVGGLERVGNDLDLTVTRSNPTGLVSMVLTAPFHFAVVQHRGARGDVYVDGVKK